MLCFQCCVCLSLNLLQQLKIYVFSAYLGAVTTELPLVKPMSLGASVTHHRLGISRLRLPHRTHCKCNVNVVMLGCSGNNGKQESIHGRYRETGSREAHTGLKRAT